MCNIDKRVFEPAAKLIRFFGGQVKTAEALGVKQGSVNGWVNARHGLSPINAQKAERLTKGEVKAVELCPELAELDAYK